MKCGIVVWAALGCMALAHVPVMAQRGGEQAGKYGWLFSLSEGKALARKTGKPLMVVLRCVP